MYKRTKLKNVEVSYIYKTMKLKNVVVSYMYKTAKLKNVGVSYVYKTTKLKNVEVSHVYKTAKVYFLNLRTSAKTNPQKNKQELTRSLQGKNNTDWQLIINSSTYILRVSKKKIWFFVL